MSIKVYNYQKIEYDGTNLERLATSKWSFNSRKIEKALQKILKSKIRIIGLEIDMLMLAQFANLNKQKIESEKNF